VARGRELHCSDRRARRACGLAVLTLLALPGAAAAAPITVNGTGDTAANDGTCTLREAITSANTNTASGAMAGECPAGGSSDVIGFSTSVPGADGFNGEIGDTVAAGSPLPAITTDTDIAGGQCTTDAGVSGPCAGIDGSGLIVDNVDSTSISGVAVTGASTGIELLNGVSGFSALGDWLGVKLDGNAGANGTGLLVGPGSASAEIGDGTAGGRNVFAFNSGAGLDIEGADDNTAEGNYFGVGPDGMTAAPSPVNVEITGTEGGPDATGNVVGGTLSTAQAATPACDGPCNVIDAATTSGIDLNGDLATDHETPAGRTTISGNLVGLDAAGVGELPNAPTGIQIGDADDVTVGGPSALDANHVVGGKNGINSLGDAEHQLIQHNLVGLNYAGTAMSAAPAPSGSHGILVEAFGGGDATILDNRISGFMDDPIEIQGSPSIISRNLIGIGTGGEALIGGITGIDIVVGSPANGNLVTDNFIQNSTEAGIELQGANGATITGNTILGSGFRGGIWGHMAFGTTFTADVRIGGETAAEENLISDSAGPAIELVENGNVRIVVARNRGSANSGPFIDLGNNGEGNSPSGPNGGMQAPLIGSARPGFLSGTALPGASVMAFFKATAEPGEIAGFLGSATADSSGSWRIDYAGAVAAGSSVGATQTTGTGTSELAVAITAADPPPPPDTDAPETAIRRAPPRRVARTWAKFRFGSDEPGSAFLCKLDRQPFKPCRSPRIYRHLRPGRHAFRVRAIDAAGNTDPSAAFRRFTLLP
jgi:CSLREA domain-containing protein